MGNQVSVYRGGGIWKLSEVKLWCRSNEQTPDLQSYPAFLGKTTHKRNPGSLDKQEDCERGQGEGRAFKSLLQEARTAPLGPGHWMALQAPQGGWGDLGVLEQNQDQGSAFTNRTEANPLHDKIQDTALSV